MMSPYYVDRMDLTIRSLTIVLCLATVTAHAQTGYKRMHNRMLDEAKVLLSNGEYQEAAKIYQLLLPVDPEFTEVRYELGLCLAGTSGQRGRAIPLFERCVAEGHTEAHYQLALALHREERFDEAVTLLQQYKDLHYRLVDDPEVERRITMCRTARLLERDPMDLQIRALGPGVNSSAHDYCPLVTADGRELYFTSRREGTTGSRKDATGQYLEDVYRSVKQGEGAWSKATNVGPPINSGLQDATVGLSPDGRGMIVYRTSDDLVSGDLWMTRMNEQSGWGPLERMTDRINTEHHEPSASIAPEGNEIYFTSDRPGGYGGRDIYRIRQLPDGSWSLPLNLGPVVNTPHDEDAPFIHSDGVTLFFSSNGHNTMGGYDVFRTTLLDGDMNGWSDPENLGYPLNTVNDDIFFTLSADGTTGYFSSERPGGLGGQDIYEVVFPSSQLRKVVVHGLVTDGLERPVRARVLVMDPAGEELVGIYNTDQRTGRFLMVLEPGGRFALSVEAPGFPDHAEELQVPAASGLLEISHDIVLGSGEDQGLTRHEDR